MTIALALTAESLTPEQCSVGDTVTVTGTGFDDSTTVTVDGSAVAATIVDDSTLTFAAPEHDSGDVEVTVGDAPALTLTYVPAEVTAAAADAPATAPAPATGWEGVIGLEDTMTGDLRTIDAGALVWSVPMPLRWVRQDSGAHDGAEVVGRIETVSRSGNEIRATGTFDLESESGREAARLVAADLLNGISMDLDDVQFEIREDPNAEEQSEEDSLEDLFFGPEGVMATTSARIRAATLVAIPAFIEAKISATDAPESSTDAPALAASSAPVRPPIDWFRDPKLPGPTALVVEEDGRVYGHLATWGVCHTAQPGGPGTCVVAPSSASGYARYHVGSLMTREAEIISVGRLTMGTGHAGANLSAASAAAHYDNTGTAVADVRAGEDQFGIWIAGALRSTVTDAQIRVLRASPLSGDWRRVDGNLELHAALAVNVPGFPIPRPQGLVASGEMSSLVASGMVPPKSINRRNAAGDTLSDSDLKYLKALAQRERETARNALAARVNAVRDRARVASYLSRSRSN